MKRKWFLSLLLLVMMVALMSVVGVSALTGYTLDWWSVDGGGEASSAGAYHVSGSIGQPEAGTTSSNGAYSVAGGFWGGEPAIVEYRIYLPLVIR